MKMQFLKQDNLLHEKDPVRESKSSDYLVVIKLWFSLHMTFPYIDVLTSLFEGVDYVTLSKRFEKKKKTTRKYRLENRYRKARLRIASMYKYARARVTPGK